MDIVYRLQGVEFEWDSNKARSNIEKHGVTFEEATEVFFDPFYQTGDANSINASSSEQRAFIIGYSLEQRLLLVVYVERGLRTRIISARPATRTERKLYEQS
ncbi:BrnT family toxin [Aliinostoc sp. HNIBRCY26]|uniref:BrnT family toxin n=1 Tax=Aliinostoc sp. HNIBRCY26 TaxID=3418997 RepID=UPI003D00B3EB